MRLCVSFLIEGYFCQTTTEISQTRTQQLPLAAEVQFCMRIAKTHSFVAIAVAAYFCAAEVWGWDVPSQSISAAHKFTASAIQDYKITTLLITSTASAMASDE